MDVVSTVLAVDCWSRLSAVLSKSLTVPVPRLTGVYTKWIFKQFTNNAVQIVVYKKYRRYVSSSRLQSWKEPCQLSFLFTLP